MSFRAADVYATLQTESATGRRCRPANHPDTASDWEHTVRPLVSVVIATYNRANLLEEALASIYAQEGQGDPFDLEVIVVDDASSDATDAVVGRYPAIYTKHDVNRGVAAALNTGIGASRGAYVGFLGDDDLWLPGKLRMQVPALEAHPDVGLVYGSHTLVGRGAVEEWTIGPSGQVFERLLMGNFVSIITAVARRSALMEVGGFDPTMSGLEDYDLCLRLAYHVRFHFVPGPVAVYRPSPQGLFATTVATGASRELHRRAIMRALGLAPNLSPETIRHVIDQMELTNATYLARLPSRIALPQMLAQLGEYPRAARNTEICDRIAWKAREESVASADPLRAAAAVCKSIELAAGDARGARRLISAVWAEVAVGLLRKRCVGTGLRAAREALRYDFPGLVRRGFVPLGRALRPRANGRAVGGLE